MTPEPTPTSSGLDVAVEERDAWERRLTITVPRERVDRARREIRDELGGRLDLDGFRQGKVPPEIVERRLSSLIDERTVQSLVSEAYREALTRKDLDPLGEPEVGNVQYRQGEELTFQVEVEVMPRLELDRVGGFQVDRPDVEVSEDEVDEVLDQLRGEHATWRPADRRPREGDLVRVRIARADRQEPPSVDDEYEFELGEGQALPDIEEAIRSLGPGEGDTFDVRFPEEVREEGQPEVRSLRVELQEVKEKELPPVDDALASRVGDFESVEALREAIREDVREHHREEAENAVREQLVDRVIEANPFEVPGVMVDNFLDRMIDAPDDADPQQVEAARRELRPRAERQIKRHLILEHLREREGLEATSEEVDARIEEIAEARSVDPGRVRRQLARNDRMGSVRRQISAEKVFAYLKDQSSVEG